MVKKVYVFFFGIFLLVVSFGSIGSARATLGESADSVESDGRALSAVRDYISAGGAYTLQEVYADTVSIREYVSSAGVVFGVAWNGLMHPELTRLLGSYSKEYHEALGRTSRKPGQRRIQVKTDRVVVEKWGHMRNLQGRAYVPDLIPEGVGIDEIR